MISLVAAHENFYRDAIVASHEDALMADGATFLQAAGRGDYSATLGQPMNFSGSLIGLGMRGSCAAHTDDANVRVRAYINNTMVFETDNFLVTGTGPFTVTPKLQAAGIDTFVEGDFITIDFVGSSLLQVRPVALLELEFDLGQVHHMGVTGHERAQNFAELESGG